MTVSSMVQTFCAVVTTVATIASLALCIWQVWNESRKGK